MKITSQQAKEKLKTRQGLAWSFDPTLNAPQVEWLPGNGQHASEHILGNGAKQYGALNSFGIPSAHASTNRLDIATMVTMTPEEHLALAKTHPELEKVVRSTSERTLR
jgi:hypothetical protein